MLVALCLTFTRATLVALLAGALVAVAQGRPRHAVVVAVIALAVVWSRPELWGRFASDQQDRAALTWAAVAMGAEAPFVGHGDIHYNSYLWADVARMRTPFGVATTTPHNSLALGFFRYGIFGALLTAAVLLWPVVWFWRRAKATAGWADGEARVFALAGVCAFVAFALQSLSNNLLEVPKIGVFFWALLPLLQGAATQRPQA
jgi:hypothetical protein